MKQRIYTDKKSQSTTMSIRLTKNETLEYSQAEWLLESPSEHFLPFAYEQLDGKKGMFYYDITNLLSLKEFLRSVISVAQYRTLLYGLADVLDLLTLHDYPSQNLLMGEKELFVTPDGSLKMAYVPASNLPVKRPNIHYFLEYVSKLKNVEFTLPENESYALQVADFTSRTHVLSSLTYRAFLDDLFGHTPSHAPGGTESTSTPLTSTSSDNTSLKGRSKALRTGIPLFDSTSRSSAQGAVQATQAQQKSGGAINMMALLNQNKSEAGEEQKQATTIKKPAYKNVAKRFGDTTAHKSAPKTSVVKSTLKPDAKASPIMGDIKLVVPRTGQEVVISDTPLKVGRSVSCDVTISGNESLSRCHFEVVASDGGVLITDLGSSNGTKVDGVKIESHEPTFIELDETFIAADEEVQIIKG